MSDPERFRAAREAAGMSKLALAHRWGISRQAIQNFERGTTPIPAARMTQIQAIAEGR